MSKDIDLKGFLLALLAGIVAGTGWYISKEQVRIVNPEFSTCYRFLLAAPIALFIGKFFNKESLRFDLKTHLNFAVIGFLLYGAFYWLSYRSVKYIPSGIVSVIMSMMSVTNFLFCYIFLKEKIKSNVVFSSISCFISLALLFLSDNHNIVQGQDTHLGYLYGFSSICTYSLGTVILKSSHLKKISAATLSGFSMIYGAFFSLLGTLFYSTPVVAFDFSFAYIGSLLYLGCFLSPVVMITYVYLSKKYSASIAASILVMMPIVGLFISSISHEMVWDIQKILGAFLGIFGIFILFWWKKRVQTP